MNPHATTPPVTDRWETPAQRQAAARAAYERSLDGQLVPETGPPPGGTPPPPTGKRETGRGSPFEEPIVLARAVRILRRGHQRRLAAEAEDPDAAA